MASPSCSRCGKSPASVFYKQIVNNQVSELQLCALCAQAAELPFGPVVPPFLELLAGLGAGPAAPAARPADCPACGLRYGEFQKSGLLGCPRCYDSFARPLEEILTRIHGAARHTGKAPAQGEKPRKPRPAEDAARLKERLKQAIREENFEEAARLRDQLREMGG